MVKIRRKHETCLRRSESRDGPRAGRFERICVGVFVLLAIASASPGNAQQELDESCVVTILNRTIQVGADGSWSMPNVPSNQGRINARATCLNPDGTTVSGESGYFSLVGNGISEPVEITFADVAPIPVDLAFSPSDTLALNAIGATAQLSVAATYVDGSTADVSGPEHGTNYSVTNPAVISVSPEGLLTAVGNGFSLVSARKDGALAVRRVRVTTDGDFDADGLPDSYETSVGLNPGDPIDALEDEDGDGLSALSEFNAGTQPFDSDSDDDGLDDGEELAAGSDGYLSDPLLIDTDGDGLNDAVEVAVGSNPSDPNDRNIEAAAISFDVTPSAFSLVTTTIETNAVGQKLSVIATLVDGSKLNLTETSTGTTYSSSNLSICNFGLESGRVFGVSPGTCTITVRNGGLEATVTAIVTQFTPGPLSIVTIPGYANNVEVDGDYAFVAAGSAGLQVVSLGNRTSPSIVTGFDTPGTSIDVKLSNGLAYVADGSNGLVVIDVSTPTNPRFVGGVDTPGIAQDLQVQGGLAFVADGDAGLQIVDITDPANPNILGQLGGLGTALGVDAFQSIAVVGSSTGIRVVDILNPGLPQLVGSTALANVKDLVIEGSYVHVAAYSSGFVVVDISNPANPMVVSQGTGFVPRDVTLSGSLAFFAEQLFVNAVALVNIADPEAATFQGTINLSSLGDWAHTGIDLDSRYFYITAESFVVTQDFGTTGSTSLLVGQYRQITDTRGIPPSAAIVSPSSGTQLVQGESLNVTAQANDDILVADLQLLVDGAVVASDASPPYALSYPTALASLGPHSFQVRAVDLAGNVGLSDLRFIDVIPDPLTRVIGSVRSEAGNPVDGASVACAGKPGLSLFDGSFSIDAVPTLTTIRCTASALINGLISFGGSVATAPNRGGTTDVGPFVLLPGFSNGNGGFESGTFSGFTVLGDARVVTSLGSISPPEGSYMALITTGDGAAGETTSRIASDAFVIPAGVQYLTLEYDFLTQEDPGSFFNDVFAVGVADDSTGQILIARLVASVQSSTLGSADPASGFDYRTGFRTYRFDVSSLAGSGSGRRIVFGLQVDDGGDAVVDSAALIDNIRFEFPSGATTQALGLPVPEPDRTLALISGICLVWALGLLRARGRRASMNV